MDIFFIYYYPSGGVETLACPRSYALKKYGVNLHFLYFRKGPSLQNIRGNLAFITNNDTEIQEIITKGHYEVIIVCFNYSFLPCIRNMNFKGKLIYEVQGLGSIIDAQNWLKSVQPYINENTNAIFPTKLPI